MQYNFSESLVSIPYFGMMKYMSESHMVANCVASYMASRLQRCIDTYLIDPHTEETLSCETEDRNLFNP